MTAPKQPNGGVELTCENLLAAYDVIAAAELKETTMWNSLLVPHRALKRFPGLRPYVVCEQHGLTCKYLPEWKRGGR